MKRSYIILLCFFLLLIFYACSFTKRFQKRSDETIRVEKLKRDSSTVHLTTNSSSINWQELLKSIDIHWIKRDVNGPKSENGEYPIIEEADVKITQAQNSKEEVSEKSDLKKVNESDEKSLEDKKIQESTNLNIDANTGNLYTVCFLLIFCIILFFAYKQIRGK